MICARLMRRAFRAAALLILALAGQPVLAVINCEIQPTASTSLTATTGDTLTVTYSVNGSCSAVTTTTSIINDTTGSTVSPPSVGGSIGPRDATVSVGNTAGTLVFRVTCSSGCFGTPANLTIDYTVSVSAPVVRNLSPHSPTSFNADIGSNASIEVIADDSGTPAGTTILWSSTGPVSLSSTATNTDPSTGKGVVTANFGPGTGTATIEARRSDNTPLVVSFSANVQPPPIRTIAVISGASRGAWRSGR